MKHSLVLLLVGAMGIAGCATKNYVRQSEEPINAKVDQVTDQANKQGTELGQHQQTLDQHSSQISAVDEKATSADQRAGDALNSANTANQKGDQNARDITGVRSALSNTVANLDNYKVVGEATVLFAFNQDKLNKDAKDQLDMLASNSGTYKHYFIAVEGYTDKTGPADYNLALSRRRAESVVQYLAGDKDVDFNHIHEIGFGEAKPAQDGKTRADLAANRRVTVQIYSADDALAQAGGTPSSSNAVPNSGTSQASSQ